MKIIIRIVPAMVLAIACLSGRLPHTGEHALAVEPDGPLDMVQSAFAQNCAKCHGKNGEPEGDVNLFELKSADDLLAKPALIQNIIEVLDAGDMPPEDEPALDQQQRDRLVAALRDLLRTSVAARKEFPRAPLRRMTRFQYNNAVQDLFQLDVVVFPLPERILREHGKYFRPQTGKMPAKLTAGNRPLGKSQLIEPRLGGVTAFPQDLRAEHGFDNRGDHLSLSPLLLESFLRLSQSIVESADFNAKTCGIWKTFFAPPSATKAAGADAASTEVVVRRRLKRFLTRAFRRPVENEILDRYTALVLANIEAGESFTASMKNAATAALASPHFFYLYDEVTSDTGEGPQQLDDFNLASRLSFFLWGSIPDQTLLDLAADGTLREPNVLTEQVERMLRDRRVKRFCDSFPAQWLQLDRIISSVPDQQRYPQFYFLKYRASLHMMLEPLLLFETVLIEDHSILKFIDSDFSYQSNLLQAWYRDGTQGNPGKDAVIVKFHRVPITDRRQGGVITNAAVMTMTSGASQTKPITRGAWIAAVILNDPPEPPPADVPQLPAEPGIGEEQLTLRERFAVHRQRADCAGCHRQIDPLGFALENYDAVGIWRDEYENGRTVDASGTLFRRHEFTDIVEFKDALLAEKDRFTRALASHLLAFSLGRKVGVEDSPALDTIVRETAAEDHRFKTLIKQVVLSDPFLY